MRIVVNDIAASSGGALSVLQAFYEYIIEQKNDSNEWIFLLSQPYINETEHIKVRLMKNVKKSWFHRLKFDWFEAKRFIDSLEPDVYLSLQNIGIPRLKAPQIIYMHQSIPFQTVKQFSFFKKEEVMLAIYQYIIGGQIKRSLKKADYIVVQTKWIREAILKSLSIDPHKIVVSFPTIKNLSTYKTQGTFEPGTFFYPASEEIYKNHECIYAACQLLRDEGIKDFRVDLTLEGNSKDPNTFHHGQMNFDEVVGKYFTSTLVFPSYIETLGLPMAEARQCGTLVLASDCPFSREVLDGYDKACFFDPFEPRELAALMKKVIQGHMNPVEPYGSIESVNTLENGWKYVYDLIQTYKYQEQER